LNRRRVYLVWFALHAFFVLTVSFQQTLWIIGQGYTSLPVYPFWQEAESLTTKVLAESLSLSNPLRQGVNAYINGTGIEGGYGFFAPSVPDSYKLVIELQFPDGHVEYELPRVSDTASGVRLATLLDQICRTYYEPLREIMIKMLAYSVWQDHPQANQVRAVFGFVGLPSLNNARQGKSESYHFLYAYDFSFHEPTAAEH